METASETGSETVWLQAQFDNELNDLFELSPMGLMLCDELGRILRTNTAMREMAGRRLQAVGDLPPELLELLGWPAVLPATAQTREVIGWVVGPDGRRCRLRVRVRGLRTPPPAGVQRWLAQFEDRSLEDERDLARVEIAALMGTAGVGVATYDAAQGWVTSAPSRIAAGSGLAAGDEHAANPRASNAGLMSIGRDVVEPESLPEYERLQQALRKRQRAEVRYAVSHPDLGRRWLLTRVEPAELGPGRPAFSVVTLDVSEEETVRRRNEQLVLELSTILELSAAGIAYLRAPAIPDPSSVAFADAEEGPLLVRCNQRFESLLGLEPGRAAGASMASLLLGAGMAPPLVRQCLAALAEQGHSEAEFRLPAAPGTQGPAWYSLSLQQTRPAQARGASETVAVLTDVTRWRLQQAELEDLERERELMFSLSDVGIIYQREGRIERANQAMAELTGRTQQELQGLPVAELYEDERAYLAYSALERRELESVGRAQGERRLLRRDGSLLWVQANQRLVDAADPSAGTISSFVSVDERRRARESLLAQADRTRAILDSVLVGIVTVGDSGIEWMNRSARRMFGGELADFFGQPIATVASREADHPLRRTNWLMTLEEGQAETFECRLMARDGREFWVVGNVVVTGREAGAGQLTFALLDIERRREAETQIAQARASLQRIIETAPLAIALFDGRSQQVLQQNQMMASFARRPGDEIEGRPPAVWLPGAEGVALANDLRQALATHETVRRELRREAAGADPAEVWEMRIVSLRATGDGEEQVLLVASDVTEQRQAEQARLDAAIAQREMLVKEVHHRIKNNLQGVAGLLQQNAQRHPEAASAIAEAVGHVHAIAQVHGLQVGMTGPLRVRGVIEAIAASVQRMFGRPIQVEVTGPAPHRFALTEADSIPIALTINELLTNAIKHNQQGEVRCRLECGASGVLVSVANRARLPAGFSLAQVPSGISGLGLVRALLPRKGAAIHIDQRGEDVVASLRLEPPGVAVLEPL